VISNLFEIHERSERKSEVNVSWCEELMKITDIIKQQINKPDIAKYAHVSFFFEKL